LDALAILAFVVYIVIKSLGDRNKQQQQRQARVDRPHPLDQSDAERPWDVSIDYPEAAAPSAGRNAVPPGETYPAPEMMLPSEAVKQERHMKAASERPPESQTPRNNRIDRVESSGLGIEANGGDGQLGMFEEILNEDNIVMGVILSEVLQRPRAYRR